MSVFQIPPTGSTFYIFFSSFWNVSVCVNWLQPCSHVCPSFLTWKAPFLTLISQIAALNTSHCVPQRLSPDTNLCLPPSPVRCSRSWWMCPCRSPLFPWKRAHVSQRLLRGAAWLIHFHAVAFAGNYFYIFMSLPQPSSPHRLMDNASLSTLALGLISFSVMLIRKVYLRPRLKRAIEGFVSSPEKKKLRGDEKRASQTVFNSGLKRETERRCVLK